jgi:hypothetical protein
VEHGLGDLLAGGAPARQGRVGRHDEGHPAFAHGHLGQGGRGGDRAASVDDHGGQPRVAGVDAQRSVAANPSHVTHEVDHLESNPVEREPVDGERALVAGHLTVLLLCRAVPVEQDAPRAQGEPRFRACRLPVGPHDVDTSPQRMEEPGSHEGGEVGSADIRPGDIGARDDAVLARSHGEEMVGHPSMVPVRGGLTELSTGRSSPIRAGRPGERGRGGDRRHPRG